MRRSQSRQKDATAREINGFPFVTARHRGCDARERLFGKIDNLPLETENDL
jgi:hypothetical protein